MRRDMQVCKDESVVYSGKFNLDSWTSLVYSYGKCGFKVLKTLIWRQNNAANCIFNHYSYCLNFNTTLFGCRGTTLMMCVHFMTRCLHTCLMGAYICNDLGSFIEFTSYLDSLTILIWCSSALMSESIPSLSSISKTLYLCKSIVCSGSNVCAFWRYFPSSLWSVLGSFTSAKRL